MGTIFLRVSLNIKEKTEHTRKGGKYVQSSYSGGYIYNAAVAAAV